MCQSDFEEAGWECEKWGILRLTVLDAEKCIACAVQTALLERQGSVVEYLIGQEMTAAVHVVSDKCGIRIRPDIYLVISSTHVRLKRISGTGFVAICCWRRSIAETVTAPASAFCQ
jgi:hypothetical protein